MKRTIAGAVLLFVQLALVLSIAGKYLYERKTRPRVWVQTTQNDPNQPLRGPVPRLATGRECLRAAA